MDLLGPGTQVEKEAALRCRARREQLETFERHLPEKWLKLGPESGLDWLMGVKFSRERSSGNWSLFP